MLACKQLKGHHTVDNLIREYEETIACFGLASKVTAVITDNASNMVAGFSLPGYENRMRHTSRTTTMSTLILSWLIYIHWMLTWTAMKLCQSNTVTSLYSEGPLVRRATSPKGHCSEGPIVRRAIAPKGQ